MEFINKTFKNKITGDSFTIIDQYQNVAITSNKEKIDVNLLSNDKLFIPVKNNTVQTMNENFEFPKKQKEDIVDPSRFFDNQNTYNAFADKIKTVDLSKIPDDENKSLNTLSSNIPSSYGNLPVATNESAIIMSDTEDEIEEIKRKYGATTIDDSVRRQNEVFSKILDPESSQPEVQPNIQRVETRREYVEPQYVEPQQTYAEQPIQRVEVQDPIISMFRNVKRNLDFKINLKIDGKIPRLDFIEMMEDSYDISIIEYLADEFTNKILSDPSIIRNKVRDEITSMIEKKNGISKKETNDLPTPSKITKKDDDGKKEVKTTRSTRKKTTEVSSKNLTTE
jgi:hypothetical protein